MLDIADDLYNTCPCSVVVLVLCHTALLMRCDPGVLAQQLHTTVGGIQQDAELCVMLAGPLQPWPQPVHLLISHSCPWRAGLASLKTHVPFSVHVVEHLLHKAPPEEDPVTPVCLAVGAFTDTVSVNFVSCLCNTCLLNSRHSQFCDQHFVSRRSISVLVFHSYVEIITYRFCSFQNLMVLTAHKYVLLTFIPRRASNTIVAKLLCITYPDRF